VDPVIRRLPVLTFSLALLTAILIGTVLDEEEGSSVWFVLLVPAMIAAIGVLWPTRGALISAAVMLSVLMVLGALTIGLFFLPTVISAWLAAKWAD